MPAVRREQALAKLTRSLQVVGRRADGYHLLRSEMVTLDLADTLELAEPERGQAGTTLEILDEVAWTPQPLISERVPEGAENLVCRALALAGREANVRLVKRIPPGAGLGGGSADAAAALRWAGLRDLSLAAQIGADVPFCLVGGRALVRGIGEVVEPLEVEARTFVLYTPPFGVSTRLVYEAFDELAGESRRYPGDSGQSDETAPTNDLEAAALAVEPRLAEVRDLVAGIAGHPPTLAGSGSTWYVECPPAEGPKLREALAAAVAAEHRCAAVTLARTVDPGRSG